MKPLGVCLLIILLPVASGLHAQAVVVSTSSPARLAGYLDLRAIRRGDGHVPAQLARPVSLRADGMPLQQALHEIARQAGLGISYGEDLIQSRTRVWLEIEQRSAAEALAAAANGTGWDVLIAPSGHITVVRAAQQQQGTISGRVTDSATGDPLSGAQVMVVGTELGTLTGSDGRYTIAGVAVGSHRLRAVSIGYSSREMTVVVEENQETVANFALPVGAIALQELVVVGYGTKTERQLASAVVQVDAAELDGVTTEDAPTMLQGKVAGVFVTESSGMPGSGPEVRIRGTGSITADSDPLYVVDGIIADANIARFMPAGNIASMTVLKDAAATALYGSRAANGVIVITTKTGQAGETTVGLNLSTGMSDPIFGNFELMNSRQLYELEQSMGVPNLTEELLSRNTDWKELAFRQGRTSNLSMSVSGGSDQTTFYISGSYYADEGTLLSTNYDRVAGRVNLDHVISDDFRVTARGYASYETRVNNPAGALYQAYTNLPWDRPYFEDGSPRTGREPDWRGREHANFLYPLQYNWSRGRSQDYSFDVKVAYDLTPWLTLSTTNRAEFENDRSESYDDPRTSGGSSNDGDLANAWTFDRSLLTSNLMTATRDFGDHSLSGIVGYEYQRNSYEDIGGTGIGIFSGLETLDATAEAFSLEGNKVESAFLSGFFQANYDYRNKYYVTVSMRRDGSSRFGADNRYGDFYSVGGAWLLDEETFLRDVAAIDQLKLRASYGTTGNAQIDDYLAQSLYSYSVQYDGQPGSTPERLANPNLTWEVARTLNVGVDAALFNRVNLSVDLYRRVNTNLLQNVPLPKTSGFSSRTLNVGSVRNQGIELALSVDNLRGAFSWTTDLNLALNRNEVLTLYGGDPILNGNQRIIEGRDLRTWYLRKWLGVDPDDGSPLWERVIYDQNGEVIGREPTSDYSDATLQPVGTATPDFSGGISNTFRYHGIELRAFFSFVYGNDLYHSARELFDSDGAYYTYNSMVLQDGWSRWQQPGDIATHPKPIPGGNSNSQKPSSRYLEDGSYLRLRNVTLSYELPNTFLPGIDLRNARVYVSGDNLLTLTDFSGMDPEASFFGSVGTKYPLARRVLFGLRLGL